MENKNKINEFLNWTTKTVMQFLFFIILKGFLYFQFYVFGQLYRNPDCVIFWSIQNAFVKSNIPKYNCTLISKQKQASLLKIEQVPLDDHGKIQNDYFLA